MWFLSVWVFLGTKCDCDSKRSCTALPSEAALQGQKKRFAPRQGRDEVLKVDGRARHDAPIDEVHDVDGGQEEEDAQAARAAARHLVANE